MPKATFSAKFVENVKPPATGQVEYFDASLPGFGLRVTSKGGKSWVMLYRPKSGDGAGKLRRYTIGTYPMIGLADARKAAHAAREEIDRGGDPAGEKMAERAAAKVVVEAPAAPETYEQAVDDYIRRYQIGERKNATAGEVKRALLKDGAAWKAKPLASLTAKEIRRTLEDIRDGDEAKGIKPRPYLSNRLHAYLATFLAWCAEPGIEKIERSPMVGLRRPWDGEEARQRVYSDDEIGALWRAGDALGGHRGAYLHVLMLTGKRKTALAGMRWDEIDDNGIWTPPQDGRRRRRNKRLHPIPLPRAALDILANLDRVDGNPYVFPADRRTGEPIIPGTALKEAIQAASGVSDFFFHAARHTVETKLAELGIQPHVRDVLLDHASARGAGAGYDHHHYADEMRAALDRWAAHIGGILDPAPGKVVKLREVV